MADFTQIIQEINDDINTNGVGAITGAKLNEVLRDMIAAVNAAKQDPLTIDATPTEDSTNPVQSGGVFTALANLITNGCLFGGIAWPNEPPTYGDDHRYFYLAYHQGNYPDFNIELDGNSLVLFYWLEQAQAWYYQFLAVTPVGLQTALDRYLESNQLYMWLGFQIFSPYVSFSIGDFVTYEGGFFVFTANHPAGQWDEEDVAEASLVDYITDYVSKQLSGKQDVISDLSTIRSGAEAGATAYQKPSGGIPASDLAAAVQTSLGKADTALQSYTETDPIFQASPAAGITSGDIADWDGKAAPIPVVDASTIPASMEPNKLYKYGTLSGDTVFPPLATPTDLNKANVYWWKFTTPASTINVQLPAAITKWNGGSAPTIDASTTYEITVEDGFGTCIKS